jgi:hypothetical protein
MVYENNDLMLAYSPHPNRFTIDYLLHTRWFYNTVHISSGASRCASLMNSKEESCSQVS